VRRLLLPSSVQRGEDQEHILEQKKTMAERRRLHALNNHMAPAGPPARGSSCCPAFVGAGAAVRKVGIIMNGVTGRMGTNQHLLRSLVPIIQEGGLALADGTALVPELLLVGRNEAKLAELAARAGNGTRYTTDLDAALAESGMDVYFDAQTTGLRAPAVRKAVAAGMHIYAEKPVADTTDNAADLAAICDAAGVKNGVVQDKLFLPGIIKLKRTIESGFFGRILSIRGEFGCETIALQPRAAKATSP
jgi:predicted dehydrogenase